MPTDNRRLPVPENSRPTCSFEKNQLVSANDLINEAGQRSDGRKTDQLRPVFANVGVVSQARGSAYVEIGHSKVICAVYGPREAKSREEFSLLGHLACEFKFATFSSRLRRQHQQDTEEKELSLVVKEALEPAVRLDKFPKGRIDVFVMVLEDDGSALAAAISCSSLALSDGGVEMYDLVVGGSLRQFSDIVLMDPSSQEERNSIKSSESSNDGSMTVGFMPSLNQVSAVVQKGVLDLQSTKQCSRLCIEACQRMYPVLRRCLVTAVGSRLKTLDKA